MAFSCLLLPLVSPLLVLGFPHYQPRPNPTGSVTLSPAHFPWRPEMNPGFTADFAAKDNVNALYFHTPPPSDSCPPYLIAPVTHQSFCLILLGFLFQIQLIRRILEWSIQHLNTLMRLFHYTHTHAHTCVVAFLSYLPCLI